MYITISESILIQQNFNLSFLFLGIILLRRIISNINITSSNSSYRNCWS